MFTRNDLISYLSDLEMTEANMRDIYAETAECLTNKKISAIFKNLSQVEEQHRTMVSDLRKLIIKKSVIGS
jgi:rubrerythrin